MPTTRLRAALPLLVAALVLLAVPAVGLAAGDGHGKEGKADFIDIKRYDLGIYTLVVFGILFAILAKFAWGPITAGLRKREAGLLAIRDEAVRAKQEAEDVRVKLQAEFAAANDKIRAMLEEARRDADDLRTKEREVGAKEAAAERDRAKREIEGAKDAALQEIYKQSVQLAALMSSKAIRRTMSADDHNRLVEEALAELVPAPARN
jgi:F-type H+-transporting ATPase subunit b